jgi:hypothetical protein
MPEHINHTARRHNQQKNIHYKSSPSTIQSKKTFQLLHIQIYSILLHVSVKHGDRLQAATKCKHKIKNAMGKASSLQTVY